MHTLPRKTTVRITAAISLAMMGFCANRALADDPQINHVERHLHTANSTYDAVGNVVQTVDPVGHTTTYAYDSTGDRSTTAAGNTTTYSYDALDRATAQTSNPSSYTYDADGNDTRTVGGVTTPSTYDQAGNSQIDDDGHGIVTRYQYDSTSGAGSTMETDPLGNTTTYSYDTLHRTTGISGGDPDGNTTTYQYDALNRRVTMTDALGGVNSTNNDTTSSGSADLGFTTRYQYDARGSIMTHSAGSTLDVTLTDMTTGTTVFKYDANAGDALGNTTTYQYDPGTGVNMGTLQGPLEGTLLEGHTYRYSYSYDINQSLAQTGTGNVSVTLDLTPLPEPGMVGLLLVGTALVRRRRSV